MSFKLNKIIFQREHTWGYESYTYDLNTTIEFPYVAGKMQELVPNKPAQIKKYKPEISDTQLFNEAGLTKLIPEIGPKGIYYLELRPGYKLNQLYIEPEDTIADIFIGVKDTLTYSFYNPGRRNYISITAESIKDSDYIYSQIKAAPIDLIWRHYFIERALVKTSSVLNEQQQLQKISKEILSADEAADFLRMNKKTLQNYASENKIKKLRGGKFRKVDLEEFLEKRKK